MLFPKTALIICPNLSDSYDFGLMKYYYILVLIKFLKLIIMKTNKLKWIALTLSALFLLQSCKVYHSKTVTVNEAILSTKRVKVNNFNNESYKFESLYKENEQLYGYTKIKSSTAKKLTEQIVEMNEKFVKILLSEKKIKEYHLQNKNLSTVLSVAIPVAVASGIAVFGYYLLLGSAF